MTADVCPNPECGSTNKSEPVWITGHSRYCVDEWHDQPEPSEASREDYLMGTCTENECTLCKTPPRNRKPGMTHAGISPYDQSPPPSEQQAFDFRAHLQRQREWSEKTFGPGKRTAGVCDHIRKELVEIEADPEDISEWIDVSILALDGAWRAGYQPQQIIDALVAKQTKNENRKWPDWRTMPADKAIEHDRSQDKPAAPVSALAALPTTHVCVPVEPTEAMLQKVEDYYWPWRDVYDKLDPNDCREAAKMIYEAMLAASKGEA